MDEGGEGLTGNTAGNPANPFYSDEQTPEEVLAEFRFSDTPSQVSTSNVVISDQLPADSLVTEFEGLIDLPNLERRGEGPPVSGSVGLL